MATPFSSSSGSSVQPVPLDSFSGRQRVLGYAVNGIPLPTQPYLATAPNVQGSQVNTGNRFTLFFASPDSQTLALLTSGAIVTLQFLLADGRAPEATVQITSSLSGSTLLVDAVVLTDASVAASTLPFIRLQQDGSLMTTSVFGTLPQDSHDEPVLGVYDPTTHSIVAAQAGTTATDTTNGVVYAPVQTTGGGGGGGGGADTQYTDGGAPPAHPIGNALEYNNGGIWQTVGTTHGFPVSETNSASIKTDLDSIVTNTTGVATSANQSTANTSLSSIATNTTGLATQATLSAAKTDLDSIVTNTTGVATAANQSTANTSLSTIATNTTGVATSANQSTANTSLSSIKTDLDEIALDTDNLATLVTNTADLLADGDHLATIDTSTAASKTDLDTLAGTVSGGKVATKAASGDFADGAITTLGLENDTAITNSASSGTAMAFFKGIVSLLSGVLQIKRSSVALFTTTQTTQGTGDSGDITVGAYTEISIDITTSAQAGTNPTIQFFWKRKGADGLYYPVWQSAVLTTAANTLSTSIGAGMAYNQSLGPTGKLTWTVGGTATPTWTFTPNVYGK